MARGNVRDVSGGTCIITHNNCAVLLHRIATGVPGGDKKNDEFEGEEMIPGDRLSHRGRRVPPGLFFRCYGPRRTRDG